MQVFEDLRTLAEIAITLAGLTGIIGALHSRGGRSLSERESLHITNLLMVGLTTHGPATLGIAMLLGTLGMPVNIGAPRWDVFDPQGRFLGVVTLPERFEPGVFRGDKVYGVWRDEFDSEYVVRLHIVGDLGVGAN